MLKALASIQQGMPAHVTQLSKLPRHIKLTALGVTVGLALMGFLAAFFRRRRRRAQQIQKKLQAKQQHRRQHQTLPHHRIQYLTQRPGSANASLNACLPNGGMYLKSNSGCVCSLSDKLVHACA